MGCLRRMLSNRWWWWWKPTTIRRKGDIEFCDKFKIISHGSCIKLQNGSTKASSIVYLGWAWKWKGNAMRTLSAWLQVWSHFRWRSHESRDWGVPKDIYYSEAQRKEIELNPSLRREQSSPQSWQLVCYWRPSDPGSQRYTSYCIDSVFLSMDFREV